MKNTVNPVRKVTKAPNIAGLKVTLGGKLRTKGRPGGACGSKISAGPVAPGSVDEDGDDYDERA
jgi:hypothetical protein